MSDQPTKALPVPSRFVFLGGAHLDQELRLAQSAIMGSSNPATVRTTPGGTALNSAGIATALGLSSILVSPVGKDAAGEVLHTACGERGIENALVVMPEFSTGSYTVLIEPDGEVLIGVADMAIYDAIDADWLNQHLAPHLADGKGLFCTANLTSQALMLAASSADYTAAAAVSPAKAPRLEPVLERLNLLFANLPEARALTGQGNAEAASLAKILAEQGVQAGVITNGSAPVVFWDGAKVDSMTPKPAAKIVDTNGSGDALAGAVLAMLAKGHSLEKAVETGLAATRVCMAHKGPYPQLRQLELLSKHR